MKAWIGDGCTGRLVSADEAVVSVMDHGFTVGDGVFETIKVTPAGPFALTRHLDRLRDSAKIVGLATPDLDHIKDAAHQLLSVNRVELGAMARLRITWTSGAAPLGSDRVDAQPTLVIAMMHQQPWPPTTTAITIPGVRNPRSPIAGAKSTSYAENVVSLMRAHSAGVSEAILGTVDGRLSEGTGTNVFVVVDERILTPALSSGCLNGITRQLVIEWFGAQEAELPLEVLATADATFLTSSTRDVHPLVRVDNREWGSPVASVEDLVHEFQVRAATDLDP